jgi:hypothetical protein
MAGSKGNKNALNGNGGRPPFYKNIQELQIAIDQYFIDNQFTTVSGLAYYLGFISRQSIYDYAEKIEFTYIIKKAVLRIEANYEMALRTDRSPAGSIFALKNMGWKDTQDHNISGELMLHFDKQDEKL